ncbi:MAG TPA: hypothetical protein VGO76_19555 [Luteibacter sp.]|jgi:hypothetical protein|nr:hypothetical protein [Luteibacter sp.]
MLPIGNNTPLHSSPSQARPGDNTAVTRVAAAAGPGALCDIVNLPPARNPRPGTGTLAIALARADINAVLDNMMNVLEAKSRRVNAIVNGMR